MADGGLTLVFFRVANHTSFLVIIYAYTTTHYFETLQNSA